MFSALPPHTVHGLPALSPTMEQGNLTEWLIEEGQAFGPGDVIARIETDKATVDLEAQDDGVLAKILVPAGTNDIEVGQAIFVTVEEEDDVGSFGNFDASESSEPAAAAPEPVAAAPAAPAAAMNYPDHQLEGLPALSPTMESGNLTEWLIKEGEAFGPGDVLARIETDKATVDLEAQDDGVIAKILVAGGTNDVAVGTPMYVIVGEQEDVAAFAHFVPGGAPAQAAATPAAAPASSSPAATATATPTATTATGGRIFASPLAKKLAAEMGLSLSMITATGPSGRIVERDVLAAQASGTATASVAEAIAAPVAAAPAKAATPAAPAAAPPAGATYTDVPNTQMRKVIAKRLVESKQEIPHYYLSVECEMDALLALRKTLLADHSAKVSVNDFVVKASGYALRKVPEVNAQWGADAIRYLDNVDVCVAVATDGGLVTPIVSDVPALGLTDISSTVKDLATRARDGKLAPNEMIGGTFTVSNLGMFGVSHFTSIINPPQVAILAVGSTIPRVVPTMDPDPDAAQYRTAQVMTVTLSCDHRVVDGAVGAQWLQAFKSCIQDPMKLLL